MKRLTKSAFPRRGLTGVFPDRNTLKNMKAPNDLLQEAFYNARFGFFLC